MCGRRRLVLTTILEHGCSKSRRTEAVLLLHRTVKQRTQPEGREYYVSISSCVAKPIDKNPSKVIVKKKLRGKQQCRLMKGAFQLFVGLDMPDLTTIGALSLCSDAFRDCRCSRRIW